MVIGEWYGVELGCFLMLLFVFYVYWIFLFFRTIFVKDSSFVEKMKKTVSVVCVFFSGFGFGYGGVK